MDGVKSARCTIKDRFLLTTSQSSTIKEKIENINSFIVPSPYSSINTGSRLLAYEKVDIDSVGYKLMRPIIGSYTDMGHLIAGFFDFYSYNVAGT
jgi:hypothetical protein